MAKRTIPLISLITIIVFILLVVLLILLNKNKTTITGFTTETNSLNQISIENNSFNQTDSIGDKFYGTTEMHWDHMPIKYKLDEYCKTRWDGNLSKNIKSALAYISNETPISFVEVESGEDILYTCNPELKKIADTNTLAEVELTYYVGTNIFQHGTVYFYKSYTCYGKAPTLFVHETMHLFGIEDKTKSDWLDIMWSVEDIGKNCEQLKIIDEDKKYLEDIYGK